MKAQDIFPGYIFVQIVSADISELLAQISRQGIILRNITCTDMLTANAIVTRADYSSLENLISSKGGKLTQLHKLGAFWRCSLILRRPVLLVGLFVLLALTVFLPTRVLFVQVTGNETVPTNLILEYAELSGVRFGASRRGVRNEVVKNSILHYIPSLQWVGVNTSGCVAVIAVEERAVQPSEEKSNGVASIVAQRDGIIKSCTATKGDLLCAPGQAVQKGDVLISGYTDVGLCIRATQAEGEVFAITEHEMMLVMPSTYRDTGTSDRVFQKISLLFGKKRINLYNECGILGSICDRMYKEWYITLPGGFQLPLGIAVEEITTNTSSAVCMAERSVQTEAAAAAEAYLAEQMISGQILHSTVLGRPDDGIYVLSGRYICEEMIGRIKQEEIIEHYGKNNGKNR